MRGAGPLALPGVHETGQSCTHMTADLSKLILAALTDALSGVGFSLITNVEAQRGWGEIDFVTVHTGLAKADASPALRQTIHDVVATVLGDRRHHVEIRWAES